jgi:acyl carrier protein
LIFRLHLGRIGEVKARWEVPPEDFIMLVQALTKDPPSKSTFPEDKAREILRRDFKEAAEESATLQEGWEPVLDSLRMVTVITALEELFDFPLPPEKVIPKGGSSSVEKGVDDVTDILRRLWDKYHSSGG